MKQITLDYQARRFNVVSAFGDGEFDHLKDWMRSELHIDLHTCAIDLHVSWTENAIRFGKKKTQIYINAKRCSINTSRD